ncbi:hypothetical protein [Aestuariibaculum sediminum]|uniref:Uncharacterized protein n=1 Tax=Aestuariibaculum sediminum TaxID=2770637 RepID=A0A8J6PYY0_9FLAO|nr:hypothetical protein [Aestuariibaculum sediminum]MBD0831383.1 hypothetical protein [Aestuariibaculum sediminum]
MKKIISTLKYSVLLIALSASLLGNATERTFSTVNGELSKTAITLNDVKPGNVLTIKDRFGVILYKEDIVVSGTYRKAFDFSELPQGDYILEIEKSLEFTTLPFTIAFDSVSFHKTAEKTTFKPFVRQENSVLYITKLAPNGEAFKIHIYANQDNEYELIHSESIKGIQSIEKAYKLKSGDYKLVFIYNNKEYTKFINN